MYTKLRLTRFILVYSAAARVFLLADDSQTAVQTRNAGNARCVPSIRNMINSPFDPFEINGNNINVVC